MRCDHLTELNRARANREAIVLIGDLAGGSKEILRPDGIAGHPLEAELARRFRSGKSGIVEQDRREIFLQVQVPAPRLVIIGAVHISQALYPMASACNFDVTIIDPRTAFATPERFRDVDLRAEWPEDVLKEIAFDAYTAVAALTHDPKIDDIPLQHALEAECFYVGALGSRKTHAKRLERLKSAGLDAQALSRIHAPIGLDIGAANPAEIAIAVMAEVIQALRKPEENK